jgi:hypothetical protein
MNATWVANMDFDQQLRSSAVPEGEAIHLSNVLTDAERRAFFTIKPPTSFSRLCRGSNDAQAWGSSAASVPPH